MAPATAQTAVMLDPSKMSKKAEDFYQQLSSKIVGQPRMVRALTRAYQIYEARMNNPGKPITNMLLMGPTGVGKTKSIEAAAEILFGTSHAAIRVDCAEYQHSHEVAKLIGSPPGYLGHRDTPPYFTKERLKKYTNEDNDFTFVLFDEIEKANHALWELMLGIMDKATLTTGTNDIIDFSKTIIVMTSNLGAKEMSQLTNGRIGFASKRATNSKYRDSSKLDQRIYKTASQAAQKRFSPEFMNRIDKVVVFRTLSQEDLAKILELELAGCQQIFYGTAKLNSGSNVHQNAKNFSSTKESVLNTGYGN